ncbi:anti-sigma factor family protein [Paracoccus fontiphilus]|uniref:Anti-sigma factor family protein n=1 Tax=Paracoccus fontiphilus TaxID=1815556 RepID=A0ABV7IC67_9RHOB
MQIDDETLMALADGELDRAEAARISAAIADDPDAQARLRRFTETRARLRALTAETQSALGDEALIARIRAAGVAPQAPAAATPAAPAPAANRNRAPLAAIAAALTAAVVGIGWWQMGGAPGGLPQAEVAVLDSLPSGEAVTLDDGRDLTMIASYRTAAGDFCREYETVRDEALTVSVACRDNGIWRQQFASNLDAGDGYVPASGDIEALDTWLSETGAGDPLTPADEAAALAGE